METAIVYPKSQIPWYCWDQKGFKACHGDQWHKAQSICEKSKSGFATVADCITAETDRLVRDNCYATTCPRVLLEEERKQNRLMLGVLLGGLGVLGFVLWKSRKRARAPERF